MTAIVGVEPAMSGAAGVKVPATRRVEFNADLRDGRAGRDWNCPCGAHKARMRPKLMPVSTTTPETHGGNFAQKGFPTARLPECGLRDNQDTIPRP